MKSMAEAREMALAAKAEFERRYPNIQKDVTVTLTTFGWTAYDWVSRKRLYPAEVSP